MVSLGEWDDGGGFVVVVWCDVISINPAQFVFLPLSSC